MYISVTSRGMFNVRCRPQQSPQRGRFLFVWTSEPLPCVPSLCVPQALGDQRGFSLSWCACEWLHLKSKNICGWNSIEACWNVHFHVKNDDLPCGEKKHLSWKMKSLSSSIYNPDTGHTLSRWEALESVHFVMSSSSTCLSPISWNTAEWDVEGLKHIALWIPGGEGTGGGMNWEIGTDIIHYYVGNR